MKTIAIVLGQLGTHGPSLIRLQIAAELVKRGLDVHLVLGTDAADLAKNIPYGCKVFILNSTRLRQFIIKLGRYLRQEKPEGVIASSWPYSASAILAVRLFARQVKLVVSEHADLRTNIEASGEFTNKDAFLIRYLSKYIYVYANKVVGVSQGVVDGLCEVTGLNKSKTTVIYNPLREMVGDLGETEHDRALRDEFWNGTSIKLLAVGRLAPEKNYEIMIDAIQLLRDKHDIKLIVIGDGALKSMLQEKIDYLSLSQHILLAGKITNVQEFYAEADVFLMSSTSEGFGNVIVEALSFGLPIVSTNCQSGPAEILSDGEYGVLTPVGDPQAFACGIDKVLLTQADPEKQKKRSGEYTIEKTTDKYLLALFQN
ncbi:MAG: glycosyltransferase [Candidatus Electrothrix sp. GW3-4]|uniref:glycosyltransferase n=1 Tax=Candidatus Electrothrix sp. GW3-4 TaxID=3126740 RepID=UPI0030CCB926